jgi:hypothetical protein
MGKISFFCLLIVCIVTLLAAGCTSSESSDAAATPTPRVIYVTVTVTPTPTPTHCYWDATKMACSDQPVTAATPSTTAPATITQATMTSAGPDPILHRWIRQYSPASGSSTKGYEFKFYSDGTVVYNEGTIQEVSSNLRIPSPEITGSGTWTKLSEDHYLVKVTPVNSSGASLVPIVRQYVRVAAYGTLPEHLVSDYEQADVDNATKNGLLHSYSEDVFYVDRVKTD